MSPDIHPCPKCGRQLAPMGVVSVSDNDELPVYQCDECLVMAEALGVKAEVSLTFVVRDGRAYNPAAPDEPFSSN